MKFRYPKSKTLQVLKDELATWTTRALKKEAVDLYNGIHRQGGKISTRDIMAYQAILVVLMQRGYKLTLVPKVVKD